MFLLLAIALASTVPEQCSEFTNCSSCVVPLNGISQCGWCAASEKCLIGNVWGPIFIVCEDGWRYTEPECTLKLASGNGCEVYKNCSDCVTFHSEQFSCGWCDSLQMCLPGTRDGADDYTPCPEPTPLIRNWWKFGEGSCDWWDLDCPSTSSSSSSSTPLIPPSGQENGAKQAESRMEMFLLVILTCIVLLVLVIVCIHLVKLTRLQRQQQHPLGIPLI